MRVFEFAINESEANEHLPQNVPENSFYYSGTHDNDTLKGWLDCNQDNKNFHATLTKRLGITTSNQINSNQLILKAMLFSKAKVIVFQLQDILEMGSEARINVPGTMTDNWVWRLEPSDWSEEKWKQFEALLKITKRVSR